MCVRVYAIHLWRDKVTLKDFVAKTCKICIICIMRRSQKITVTMAVREFADLVNRVHYGKESIVLTKGNKEVAQILPLKPQEYYCKDLKSLLEKESPLSPQEQRDLLKDIKKSKEEFVPETNPWDI